MRSSRLKRERRRRSSTLASLGATLFACASALGADGFEGPGAEIASPPVGTTAVEYTAPMVPNGALRLRLDLPPSSIAALLVTKVDPVALPTANLTLAELSTATLLPVPLDAAGDLDVQATLPSGVTPASIQESGLRFRVLFVTPTTSEILVTDPISVVPDGTDAFDPATAAGVTDESGLTADACDQGAATTTSDSTATATSAATATPPLSTGSLATAVQSTTAGSTASGTTSAYTAPPPPSASKTSVGGGNSISWPASGSVAVRLLTNNSFLSATHDQPSPIQGSGH